MAYACVDGIEQTGSIHSLPITLDQRASATSTVVVGTFIFFAACFLLAPFGLVAALAALDPNSFMAIAQNPSTAIQLGLALLVGIMFVALPLRRLLRRVFSPRCIVISDRTVSATNTRNPGAPQWSEPLAAYKGVAHHVRTTLSGAHHEIVLIHDEPSKSVVLQTADRIAQPQVDAVAILLNVALVPARIMYDRSHTIRPPRQLKVA